MKTTLIQRAALLVLLSTLNFQLSTFAQSTAFTYQGRFNTNNAPYTGPAEFQFVLWDAASDGNAVATNNPASVITNVTAGLFTANLDFGSNPFNGQPRFLQIDARTTIGAFNPLTPRQPLTPTPYALRALNLTTNGLAAGTYASEVTFNNAGNSFNGSFTGNGAGLANVTAATLGGLSESNFWQAGGNGGTTPGTHFLGTTDNQPLEFKVNGRRALRLEPAATANAVNVIGGSASNSVAPGVEAATIAGGGLGPFPNSITASYATIGGGTFHQAKAGWSTIAGGQGNRIEAGAEHGTIAGGDNNVVSVNAAGAVISGGQFNQVYADLGTVGGGQENVILFPGHDGTIAGGVFNEVWAPYAVIGGGLENTIETDADGSVIAGGAVNRIGAGAASNFIGGGVENRIEAASGSAIVGGYGNHLESYASVISGGQVNGILNAEFSAIAGGENNHIGGNSHYSAIGGGAGNQILVNSSGAMIPGGFENVATNLAFAAGKNAYAVHSGAFVWADAGDARFYSVSANEFAVRATGGARFATAVDGTGEPTAGVALAPGSGAWNSLSDRNAKENFSPANAREILDKVAALPMTSWNYKTQGKNVRHLGPVAQDFHTAFGLNGPDDKHIATIDADGVALAAIQGLNRKLEEKESRIQTMERELAALKEIVTRLSNQRE